MVFPTTLNDGWAASLFVKTVWRAWPDWHAPKDRAGAVRRGLTYSCDKTKFSRSTACLALCKEVLEDSARGMMA